MAEPTPEVPTLAERLARIATLERALAVATKRSAGAPKARAEAETRVAKLKKQVAGLEAHRAKKGRAKEPLRIKNGTALAVALLGPVVTIVGVVLQVRLLAEPLVWVKTTCVIVDGGEDPNRAVPALRQSASFADLKLPPPTEKVACWIPDSPRGDGIGRLSEPVPPGRALSAAEKLRRMYVALMLGGLAFVGLGAWAATEPPAED